MSFFLLFVKNKNETKIIYKALIICIWCPLFMKYKVQQSEDDAGIQYVVSSGPVFADEIQHQTVPIQYPQVMGESIRKVKVRELIGLDKNSSIGEEKAECASRVKQGIHFLLSIGMQMFSYLQQRRAHQA